MSSAWPAAMSHSLVGAKPRIDVGRAFGDAAEFHRRAAGLRVRARKPRQQSVVAGSRCERLTSATAPSDGQRRVWIGSRPRTDVRLASAAARPRARRCRARAVRAPGAATMPAIGAPIRDDRDIDGVFVAAGDEFAVPSSGSTRMKLLGERRAAPRVSRLPKPPGCREAAAPSPPG